MQQSVKCPEQTPPLEISLKGREVQRVFSPPSTDKALEAQFLSFKVIHVSGGATGNLQCLWLSGDHTAGNFFSFSFFWKGVGGGGAAYSLPLSHPSSVSTGLGISETSHNKLCSVRKGADAMKKQMLQSKMVFLGSQSLLQGY